MTTTALVPGLLPCAINGRPFLIEPTYERTTLDVIRQQSDTSDLPGEQSLNPYGLWRRSQESWHRGAGQTYLDGKWDGTAADPERWNTGYHIDPWTVGQLSLLPATESIRSSSNTNLACMAVGLRLYIMDGNSVLFSSDPHSGATWSDSVIQAGQAAQTPQSMTTNGNHIWVALGTSGIHRTTRGATSSTADVPAGTFTLVGYANGRLLAANTNVLYEITDPLGTPAATVLWTHPNTDFTWAGVSAGRNCIYAFGNSGANAEVYRIGIEATTSALGAPIFATYLPDGETIHALQFYAGAVIMGTSKGVRVASADGQGNLDYGPLITTREPVYALEPQDRWCWFGLSNNVFSQMGVGPETRSGLGRLDLGRFTSQLVPAWAPDIFSSAGAGRVTSAATLQPAVGNDAIGYLCFAVSNQDTGVSTGFYRVQTSGGVTVKEQAGYIVVGQVRFNTSESKTPRFFQIRHHALPAGSVVNAYFKIDGGAWNQLGQSSVDDSMGISVDLSTLDAIPGVIFPVETIDIGLELTRSSTTTISPELVRWTLKVLPNPRPDETFTITIDMKSRIDTTNGDGATRPFDVQAEVAAIKTLEQNRTLVDFQLGEDTHSVYVVKSQFKGEQWASPRREYAEGKMVVVLQTVAG